MIIEFIQPLCNNLVMPTVRRKFERYRVASEFLFDRLFASWAHLRSESLSTNHYEAKLVFHLQIGTETMSGPVDGHSSQMVCIVSLFDFELKYRKFFQFVLFTLCLCPIFQMTRTGVGNAILVLVVVLISAAHCVSLTVDLTAGSDITCNPCATIQGVLNYLSANPPASAVTVTLNPGAYPSFSVTISVPQPVSFVSNGNVIIVDSNILAETAVSFQGISFQASYAQYNVHLTLASCVCTTCTFLDFTSY